MIKDPRSIDVLDEMTWWEPDWDEFRALALKAALALSNINTPKAIEVLRGVAATADPRTRDFAQGALEFAQSPKGKAERRPDV